MVVLPTIARDLHAGIPGLQWVVDGYIPPSPRAGIPNTVENFSET